MSHDSHGPQSLPSFAALFGAAPAVTTRAPGRVNLIGEHTDYSEGFVFPTAIPRFTTVELSPRQDKLVRAISENAGAATPVQFELGQETKDDSWVDYLKGCTVALARAGYQHNGFDLRMTSTVPLGAGLSSSASFEVAVLRAIREAFGLTLDDVKLALLGQKSETDFVGAPIGVMDQMAASLADTEHALLLDTRTLQYERVPLPAAADWVVLNSGVTHSHAGGEYRTRRAECEAAAMTLGVRVLRDFTLADLPRIEQLPPEQCRRARHVVKENARVQEFAKLLRAGDLPALGRLLYEGHASLRDDFEVSVKEIDLIVEIARTTPGVYGARLTGGGFGGSVVILADVDKAKAAGDHIAKAYAQQSGRTPTVLTLKE
ncbi:MAG: galactokinase [Deltaproteobacteria bacterium]|nr:galactokinase [Deltaproteobacteria bacterium]